MKIRFVCWDWKGQPDIEWLNEALKDVFNGKNTPCVMEIETDGDDCAIVVSSEIVDKKQAQKIYDDYDELPEEMHPSNKVLDIELPQG